MHVVSVVHPSLPLMLCLLMAAYVLTSGVSQFEISSFSDFNWETGTYCDLQFSLALSIHCEDLETKLKDGAGVAAQN